jgi:hypothetical protein
MEEDAEVPTVKFASAAATVLLRSLIGASFVAALALPLSACQAGQAGDAPSGYTVVRTVDSGKALSRRMPQVKTVRDALKSTLADLELYFGSKLQMRGAYEDTRDRLSGGAGFKGQFKGRPIQGIISCRIGPDGALVAVVYANGDAPRSEWTQLLAASPADGPGPGAAVAEADGSPAGAVPLKPYKFPDGTGVIGIASGWHTTAQSCAGPLLLQGPADQSVAMGLVWSVSTPDSLAVQNHRQMVATARQLGSRPPQLDMLVAPFSGPLDALKSLAPQLSEMNARKGGSPFQMDRPALVEEMRPSVAGGRAARVSYGVSEKGADGRVKHYRAEAYLETSQVVPGAWMMMGVIMRAPDATFERDLPAMRAMVFSLKENAQVIGQKAQEALNAQNQWFQAQQQAHRQQVEGFERQQQAHREVTNAQDRQNRNWEKNQNATSRSHDDYDEVLRGYRTVEDTRSGVKTSVDLGNVDVVVDKLNEADPGRYRQIPLRDEMDPLPAR